ncbi:MAG TPA: hypothetical protein VGO57_08530 [Verrucomicrobiae bacterium]|jgi:hypothetical protein
MTARINQPDLFAPRTAVDAGASWLEKLLFEAKCWMSARDIMMTTQGRIIDREIRQVASECNRIISGQKGYKHIAHATAGEVDHSANWLISQGKKMIRRGIAQRSEAHKILG